MNRIPQAGGYSRLINIRKGVRSSVILDHAASTRRSLL